MKPKTLSLLALGLLVLCVAGGGFYLKQLALKQGKDNRWKVGAAFQELELVFPTAFKMKKGTGPAEPDLPLLIGNMNTVLERATPTRLESVGDSAAPVPYEPMRYRIGRPDAQWQMVLSYEKKTRQVRAEAYGVDPSAPVSTRLYPCCRW